MTVATAPRPRDLLTGTVRFCRLLRARGLAITPTESHDAVRALAELYEQWEAAAPDQDHRVQLEFWRARIEGERKDGREGEEDEDDDD